MFSEKIKLLSNMLNDRVDDLLLRLPNGCSQFLIHAKGIFYNLLLAFYWYFSLYHMNFPKCIPLKP